MAEWSGAEPPKDRDFLAYALPIGLPELVEPIRLVARWERTVEQWPPVKVPGDTVTGMQLRIICWSELPATPRLENGRFNPGWQTQAR